MKYIILIISFFSLEIAFCQCDGLSEDFGYDPTGCDEGVLQFLQDIIDNSLETINMDLDANGDGIIQPLELGWGQLWEDSRLTGIFCNSCGLSGEIPNSMINAIQLVTFVMCCNEFSGLIPENIGLFSNLYALNLAYNYLTGMIPESIGNLSLLTYLALNDNFLLGSIPESLCNLNIDWDGTDSGDTEYFEIINNYFCQEIPYCLEYIGPQNCEYYLPGDPNQDDIVDILDIVMVVNYIIENQIPDQFQEVNSDINEDSTIDILDINLIVEIILDNR